ncbi:diacylglycerol/lipid kinase family protein [Christiangramia sabulilitoris]|uniref:YegS/Rv2252/BmrU family lipid kinase n=1 Tax=Christiangramia sabulilitoris TaxID=2583991 RepID=A0A550I6U7_9FLAO|nr:YegS/Rv2252/BmrU family lipid kinase [Christiangramia sabulilitoris]TRO66704.1 YegS/Rv2252/BmrU family lipid kinase [Christiangramia sabulilitoris]
MNFKEVLLVVNPISGDTEKVKIISRVRKHIENVQANFHLYSTTGENDKENILSRIKDHKIDRVLVAGGDGTINLVANAIKDFNIAMGIIPAGSANGLAVNFNIPEDLDEQIMISLGSNTIDLDLICLDDSICLHLSDLGINAELIKNYDQSSIRGKFGYLLNSIPTLIQSEFPFEFTIETESRRLEARAILLGIANANKYGTGANVNPKGVPNDGKFEILIFKKLSITDIIKTLRNESDLDPDFVEIIQSKKAKVYSKKPVAFQIDGEYIGKRTEIDIKIIPRKLKMVIP